MRQKRNRRIGNLRKTIRVLQQIPIVLSFVVVVGFLCDTYDLEACWYLCPVAGFSIYVLAALYVISRRMYVSLWSRMLYLNLMMVSFVDLIDSIFKLSVKFVELQELVFCMFITGVLSSLCTYVHGKWQNSRKKQ